jgi:hypothetical protein
MKINATVTIEGTKPLLINTFPIDTLDVSKKRSGTTGNDSSLWKKTVLARSNGQLYVFGSYLIGSIVGGGKLIKVGRGSLSKKVGSTLEILEPELDIVDRFLPDEEQITRLTTDPVYLDVRSVVNPMTKGRNLRYRVAISPGWQIKATLMWEDRALSAEDVKVCLENGGLFEGIGDGRRIGFGRFVVKDFAIKK